MKCLGAVEGQFNEGEGTTLPSTTIYTPLNDSELDNVKTTLGGRLRNCGNYGSLRRGQGFPIASRSI